MLTKIKENIWCMTDTLRLPGGLYFPIRMTIVKLNCGSLWLHSPVKINNDAKQEINNLGKVKAIVAPNCFHHLYIADCKTHFPEASVFCAPGLEKKRKDLHFDSLLDSNRPSPWPELKMKMIRGAPAMNEFVFFHPSTSTLIVTDLVFNIHSYTNWFTSLVFRMVGAHQRCAQSRAWRFVMKDRNKACEDITQMLDWDIDCLIMAHGDILKENAKPTLREGLSWILKTAK